eukprot:GEMP01026218.1.p1 GENE.GEMP01026218.1~~GEMP01026218.1.p1  ORF type:complete len:269 (+),score=44.45 GEMP01026218.1:163-969(+)
MDLDYSACLRRGAIGGIGSLPGTLCSHPFDVLKIRMQVSGDSLRNAIAHICRPSGIRGFYRGVVPALEQRLVTRGPMFLVSELYTQILLNHTSMARTEATFVGSAGSGFTTGALASLAEYRKKLLSQNAVSAHDARWDRLIISAKQSGNLSSMYRRMRGAGICSAVYDSTFFGTEHFLQHEVGLLPFMSYSLAAATAVVTAFAIDSAVAGMMVIPPNQPCKPILSTTQDLLGKGVTRTYRGLIARMMEFACNYAVVGFLSTHVIRLFD